MVAATLTPTTSPRSPINIDTTRHKPRRRCTSTSTRTRAGGIRIATSFGVAASPDLSFLPFSFAAAAYGAGSVVAVLGVFAIVTLAAFVGLTVIATAIGYQMQGEWLEDHARTITAIVLIAIGTVAFLGL